MIIDPSAVVAVLRNEPERGKFAEAIAAAASRSMAAPNLLETAMVLAGRQEDAILERLDAFLREASIRIQPFGAEHAAAARHAFLRYGKGRHKAGLNFGDCIAYATAKLEAEPLLFKEEGFRLTDIEAAA
jgi:ribonuclease VapC